MNRPGPDLPDDERAWGEQQRILRAVREGRHVRSYATIGDAEIFQALARPPSPGLPPDFARSVAGVAEARQAGRRQVRRFRRGVFAALGLAYVASLGLSIPLAGAAWLRSLGAAISRDLPVAGWLMPALAVAALLVVLDGTRHRPGGHGAPGS